MHYEYLFMAKRWISNPMIMLREEFDDWAFLFNPDNSEVTIINPVGVIIWKMLDGHHTIEDIAKIINENFSDVPDNVQDNLITFIRELEKNNLVGYEVTES